ncbi:unnamed protein product [Rotaria sp. Silwood1]|nr:unnamed protein product [Rotaria sp. Silwood1]
MDNTKNSYFTEDENEEKIISIKRVITISSDDEDREMNETNKRQRSSSLGKYKPLQIVNKQPIIGNTRQTSLSIIRTSSNDNGNEERKWNLKMITSSSNESSSKQSKKKITQTKSFTVAKSKSSSTLVRTVSSPSSIKQEITIDQTRTVSLDGIDIDEEEVFSQWNDESNSSLSVNTITTQTSSTSVDSKSIWKQIFSKSIKSKPVDDELKQQWSELDKDQSSNYYRFNTPTAAVKRTCPFYKKIPGTTFCIDAFNFGNIDGIQAYFLSHFHSDHYGGLNKKFSNMLYSNQITCNLCKSQLGIRPENMTILPMDVFTTVHGIDVALLDANHCPGSNMFLFRFPNGKLVLHTGDFRAAPHLLRHPLLQPNQIDTIYLDTTYCDSHYCFPSQDEVIKSAVELVLDSLKENARTLIAIGTYLIGKERIFHAIAKALDCKIFVETRKFRILNQLENTDLSTRLTTNPDETNVHVVGMGSISQPMLQTHLDKYSLKYNKIIGIKPTGWTTPRSINGSKHYSIESKSSNITIYGFPYSEHSSFDELKYFIQYLKPKRIIPTVNVGRANVREKMNEYFQQWLSMPIVIIGGVTAVGKTSTAKRLKDLYGWDYIEADEFHSKANIDKMTAGIALTDEDRLPWLQLLHEQLKKYLLTNRSCVMTCSALKRSYRHILLTGSSNPNAQADMPKEAVYLIILTLSREALHNRLLRRQHEHFMNPLLLDSQIAVLELPINQEDEPYTYLINCDDLSQDEVICQIQMLIKK